jgi:hypothetical protein
MFHHSLLIAHSIALSFIICRLRRSTSDAFYSTLPFGIPCMEISRCELSWLWKLVWRFPHDNDRDSEDVLYFLGVFYPLACKTWHSISKDLSFAISDNTPLTPTPGHRAFRWWIPAFLYNRKYYGKNRKISKTPSPGSRLYIIISFLLSSHPPGLNISEVSYD